LSDRWQKSRELFQRAQRSLIGGVSSPFRAKLPVPLYFKGSNGCRLQDVDDNEYTDYALGWGPLILGHQHHVITEAVRQLAGRTHGCGSEHELEFQVAEKIQQVVPCAERVAYTSSGSEAVQLAMRLARGFTGRNLILKFEGHYHGWIDSSLLSYHPAPTEMGPPDHPCVVLGSRGQPPNSVENMLVGRWNSLEAVGTLLEQRAKEIAAVMMEPVLCNSGCILPREGYLEDVRDLCREHGVLLIFDEVITGFRLALGGAQARYNVLPDLAVLGKAMAGGAPLSAVVGRKDIMELVSTGTIAFGGTFNGNPISLACARATLEELSRENGDLLVQMNRRGQTLMKCIRDAASLRGIPAVVSGFGGAFAIHFRDSARLQDYRDTLADDRALLEKFLLGALQEGIYSLPDGRFYVSVVHTDDDIERTAKAIDRVFRGLR
jgi:glutamate-1-semialdehyde 2,1-aminomutase